MASIKDQLQNIVINKVKLANNMTVRQNLIQAINYLYECIQYYIDKMYEEYTPTRYKRRPLQNSLRSSLYVEDFLEARIVANTIQLSLKFSSNVWAWNMDDTHQSPVNVLMNEGWAWREQPKEPIWRFTYYEGYHFIEKGIALFNQNNKWGVKVMWDIDLTDWF